MKPFLFGLLISLLLASLPARLSRQPAATVLSPVPPGTPPGPVSAAGRKPAKADGTGGKGTDRGGDGFRSSRVKTWNLADRMKHYRVNGLSVAVINGGAVEWAKAYGVADAGTREPVTPNTLFQTASVGKMIAALAALQLVKAGRIGLDET
jgi:CubicO group peptidase (beta-lactamase class C family)